MLPSLAPPHCSGNAVWPGVPRALAPRACPHTMHTCATARLPLPHLRTHTHTCYAATHSPHIAHYCCAHLRALAARLPPLHTAHHRTPLHARTHLFYLTSFLAGLVGRLSRRAARDLAACFSGSDAGWTRIGIGGRHPWRRHPLRPAGNRCRVAASHGIAARQRIPSAAPACVRTAHTHTQHSGVYAAALPSQHITCVSNAARATRSRGFYLAYPHRYPYPLYISRCHTQALPHLLQQNTTSNTAHAPLPSTNHLPTMLLQAVHLRGWVRTCHLCR